MSGTVAPNTTTNGLVLYLDAANPRSYPGSGTTWYDMSRSGNDLKLSGSTPPAWNTTGGGSFYFDGSTSYAVIDSNSTLQITKPTVIVICTTPVAGYSGIVMTRGQAGSYYNYGISSISTTAFSGVNTSCPNGVSGLTATTATMNVYAAAWDGTAVQYYRNGVYAGSDTTCYSPNTSAGTRLSVGAALQNDLSYASFFTGNIAVVQLYNRQLSSAEIINNCNGIKSRYGI